MNAEHLNQALDGTLDPHSGSSTVFKDVWHKGIDPSGQRVLAILAREDSALPLAALPARIGGEVASPGVLRKTLSLLERRQLIRRVPADPGGTPGIRFCADLMRLWVRNQDDCAGEIDSDAAGGRI